MNCNSCSSQFDHNTHVPRLLIFCGHSLCESCCRQLHNNNRIQCPQCMSSTFIQQVNFLPKNLALLKVNSAANNTENICLKHQKKYEAYCKKQKVLICVDCILHDNHRNHEMDSIKNAYSQQQNALASSILKIENILKLTQQRYQENNHNEKISAQNYETCLQSLVNYFQQIKELIQKQQQTLFFKLKDQYTSSLQKFQQKNGLYLSQIQQLTISLVNLKHASKLSQIQFLSQVTNRQQIIHSINQNVQESQKQLTFNYQKNFVAENVIKNIQKSFKVPGNSINPITHNPVKTSIPSIKSKKSSIHGQPMANIKSYQSQQISANQNVKPGPKKNLKKDFVTITSAISNSGAASFVGSKPNCNAPLIKSCTNVQTQKKSMIFNKQKNLQKQRYDIARNCDVSIVEQKQSLFNSFLSNMTSFLSQHKFIYVIGGFEDDNSNMIKLNLNTLKWQQVSTLKSARSKFGCVSIDKNIFILGGKKGRQRLSDIEIWNQGNWKSACSLKRKRSGFGIVTFQNFIYVIGGNDGQNILNGVEILNTLTGQWSKTEPMLQARDQLAVCLGKDNKIYAIGGFGGKNNEPLKSVQVYDINTQKWQKMPSLNIQRRALAAASLADGIYAIGGFDGSKHLNSVEKYQQGNQQWIRVADLKRGRCTHSAISIFETQQIIVMGGFDQQALDSVQKYSLISNQWEQITKMPSPRFMHSCVALNQ